MPVALGFRRVDPNHEFACSPRSAHPGGRALAETASFAATAIRIAGSTF
jgi:hypothetical protein